MILIAKIYITVFTLFLALVGAHVGALYLKDKGELFSRVIGIGVGVFMLFAALALLLLIAVIWFNPIS